MACTSCTCSDFNLQCAVCISRLIGAANMATCVAALKVDAEGTFTSRQRSESAHAQRDAQMILGPVCIVAQGP